MREFRGMFILKRHAWNDSNKKWLVSASCAFVHGVVPAAVRRRNTQSSVSADGMWPPFGAVAFFTDLWCSLWCPMNCPLCYGIVKRQKRRLAAKPRICARRRAPLSYRLLRVVTKCAKPCFTNTSCLIGPQVENKPWRRKAQKALRLAPPPLPRPPQTRFFWLNPKIFIISVRQSRLWQRQSGKSAY